MISTSTSPSWIRKEKGVGRRLCSVQLPSAYCSSKGRTRRSGSKLRINTDLLRSYTECKPSTRQLPPKHEISRFRLSILHRTPIFHCLNATAFVTVPTMKSENHVKPYTMPAHPSIPGSCGRAAENRINIVQGTQGLQIWA